jgi:hypothetical protein
MNLPMYAPGRLVKIIVCSQGPSAIGAEGAQLEESLVNAGQGGAPHISADTSEFHFPTALLQNSSPVFASMLDGQWKESGEGAITINTFPPDVFRAFLDSLVHLANDTARSGDLLIFTPCVIRKVLPVAQYFQVDVLKQQILSMVMEQCQRIMVTEPGFITAADSLFAVESSLPESEIPDWPKEMLRKVARLMLQSSVTHDSGFVVNKFQATTNIEYKPNDGINHLSHKTLKKCFQSLSLQVEHTLPGLKTTKGSNIENAIWVSWPEPSSKLL